MPHNFESGFAVRKPMWHNLQDAVLEDYPDNWPDARKAARLDWEVEVAPAYVRERIPVPEMPGETVERYAPTAKYNCLFRSDTKALLSIQPSTYAVITNSELGQLIDYVMGLDVVKTWGLKFEAVVVLKGGRIIAVTMKLDREYRLPNDPSTTVPYFVFILRHDGQGGVKGGAVMLRVVCSNTQAVAEYQMGSNGSEFTVRHTANWADRLEAARDQFITSVATIEDWEQIARDLARTSVGRRETEEFLRRWMRTSSDMTPQQEKTVEEKRAAFRRIYEGVTCEGIAGTRWGVLQAALEVSDWVVPARSAESRLKRTLIEPGPDRSRAFSLVRSM